MEWLIEYYQKTDGSVPVLMFINTMSAKMQAKILREIDLLEEHGIFLGAPYVKKMQGESYKGLYELRVKQGSDITRIFYFLFDGHTFVLLHGFLKKTNNTPVSELEKARTYKTDYERRVRDE